MIPVIICGSRTFNKGLIFPYVLRSLYPIRKEIEIWEGGCPTGADAYAKLFAEYYGLKHRQFKADWDRFGKAAGPIRNSTMREAAIEVGECYCYAFWDGRSPGTADMVEKAKEYGIPTKVHIYRSLDLYFTDELVSWQDTWGRSRPIK